MIEINYTHEELIKSYDRIKTKRLSTGIDRISKENYKKIILNDLSIVERKLGNGTYIPSVYKEVLLIKDYNSLPRRLSLPTIRDRVILETLRYNIKKNYSPSSQIKSVQETISDVALNIKTFKYNYIIKIDIKKFYDMIVHKTLLEKISIHCKSIDDISLSLIEKYLTTPTIQEGLPRKKLQYNNRGIPQGISISNILGNIYLDTFDTYNQNKEYYYTRYVDDILILCDEKNAEEIYSDIEYKLKQEYELTIHDKHDTKTVFKKISNFTFLGYTFDNKGKIGICDNNIHKLTNSLEKMFSDYSSSHNERIKNNKELLLWKLNLRITGCFAFKKRYGWVIFFIQNEKLELLYHLDWVVKQLCLRFKVYKDIYKKTKSFVKTYHEFSNKQEKTNYIPTLDKIDNKQKRQILIEICKRKKEYIDTLSDYILEKEFNSFVFNSIKDIEKDLYQIYT